MDLSGKEKLLYDFISERPDGVTAKEIEAQLGTEYLGAVGKLLREDLIGAQKKPVENANNRWGVKYIKHFFVKGENKDE